MKVLPALLDNVLPTQCGLKISVPLSFALGYRFVGHNKQGDHSAAPVDISRKHESPLKKDENIYVSLFCMKIDSV